MHCTWSVAISREMNCSHPKDDMRLTQLHGTSDATQCLIHGSIEGFARPIKMYSTYVILTCVVTIELGRHVHLPWIDRPVDQCTRCQSQIQKR
jgi:hypothetical protein